MSTPSENGGMKIETQAAEVEKAQLERLTDPTPEDLKEILTNLGYDALNDKPPEDIHQRRMQVKGGRLYSNFHKAGKHGELFVIRGEGDKIIGLLGLRADAPNQTGHITLLRASTRDRAQFGIAEKLLIEAERYLRGNPRNCTRAIIEGPNPSERVKGAAQHGHLAHFYEVQKSEEAENDNQPESKAA